MASKVLFKVFREGGPIFDVFFLRDKLSGAGRGFGFVQFKTEWDTNRAIQRLNGRLVGGRHIGVRKAKYLNRNVKQSD